MTDFSSFNFIDAIAGVVLLVGILGGLKRGLSGELSRVIAIAVAVFAAWRFATPVADWAMEKLSFTQGKSYVFSFLAVLVVAFLFMWLVRVVLRNLMEFAFKGRIERIGGALAGLLRAAVIVSAVLLMIGFAPQAEIQSLVTEKSFVGRLVTRHLRPVYQDIQEKAPGLGLPMPEPPADTDLGETTNESYGEEIAPEAEEMTSQE